MNAIATLTPGERGQIFTEAGARLGFAPFHVEKDFWVCWTLATLFSDGEIGGNLAFRGGTSLSKGWQCIERFSEDIDLAINRSWMGGDELVEFKEDIITTSERERRYKRLREQCRRVIREVIAPHLIDHLGKIADRGSARVVTESIASDRDPFVVRIEYPGAGLTPPDDYFQPVVKIELSGRAEDAPAEPRLVVPYISELFPELFADTPRPVSCVLPHRTFWEKAALLHEQHTNPKPVEPANRQSRHLYDLHQLWTAGNLKASITHQDPMFREVMVHRSDFFPYGWVNHREILPGDLQLVPEADRISAWVADFTKMKSMFFGVPPSFEQILTTIRNIQASLSRP
jgi:hypothetical protein